MKQNFVLKILTAILFIMLFAFGVRLAQGKALWNDELYSQVYVVEKLSYSQILAGHVSEGNNSPLFYVLQKVVCDVTQYAVSFVWNGQWSIAEPRGQVILRIMPNLFMSLALVAIFYVFATQYSFLAGIYAFLTAIFTLTVWQYWAEARPYAAWCCLTTFQALYFLKFVLAAKENQKDVLARNWRNLSIVHILLSLTAVFGAVQAFIVSILLYALYEKAFIKYSMMLFLPLLFGFFYFLHAPHYVFGLPSHVMVLILENIPADRLLLIVLCVISAIGFCVWQKDYRESLVVMRYVALTILMIIAALGIMVCLSLTADTGWQPFVVSSRYFIFLAPVGIVSVVVFSLELLRIFHSNRWMTVNLVILLSGFLVLRFLKVITTVVTMIV